MGGFPNSIFLSCLFGSERFDVPDTDMLAFLGCLFGSEQVQY